LYFIKIAVYFLVYKVAQSNCFYSNVNFNVIQEITNLKVN